MIRMGIVWKSEVSMRKQRRWEFGDRRWLAAEISGQPQAPSGVEGTKALVQVDGRRLRVAGFQGTAAEPSS